MINTYYESYFWKQNQGKLFRRKNGRVPHMLDKIHYDPTYERYYNFTNVAVRFTNQNTGRGKWVTFSDADCNWILLPEEEQPESQEEVPETSPRFLESIDRDYELDVPYSIPVLELHPTTASENQISS